jgi:hypothetical protein
MDRIWGTFLFICLAAVAWNVFALVLSWFGIYLPAVDSGMNQ